jgi:hypothetical protein
VEKKRGETWEACLSRKGDKQAKIQVSSLSNVAMWGYGIVVMEILHKYRAK